MTDTILQADGHRWHDMGGAAAGEVPLADHDFALWEKRVDALMILCSAKGHFTIDGLRRALEDMPPSSFEEQVIMNAGLRRCRKTLWKQVC